MGSKSIDKAHLRNVGEWSYIDVKISVLGHPNFGVLVGQEPVVLAVDMG